MNKPWHKQLFCKHAWKKYGWHFWETMNEEQRMNWYLNENRVMEF
jgi:hypothetical protein